MLGDVLRRPFAQLALEALEKVGQFGRRERVDRVEVQPILLHKATEGGEEGEGGEKWSNLVVVGEESRAEGRGKDAAHDGEGELRGAFDVFAVLEQSTEGPCRDPRAEFVGPDLLNVDETVSPGIRRRESAQPQRTSYGEHSNHIHLPSFTISPLFSNAASSPLDPFFIFLKSSSCCSNSFNLGNS